jgi:hypothetical protein
VRYKPDLKIGPPTRSRPVPKDDSPAIRPLCFVRSHGKFVTFRSRYRPGYEDFSFFYPPNHPITNMPTMPLIIPPNRRKLYTEFGFVFRTLWREAERRLQASREWVIIGFSFPEGDQRVRQLLSHAAKARRRPVDVVVVNPDHRKVEQKLGKFLPKARTVSLKGTEHSPTSYLNKDTVVPAAGGVRIFAAPIAIPVNESREVGGRLDHWIGVLLSKFRWSTGVPARVFGKAGQARRPSLHRRSCQWAVCEKCGAKTNLRGGKACADS